MATTKWMHRGQECDGEWTKTFATQEEAAASLREYALANPAAPIQPRRRYTSDIGGQHWIAPHDGLSDEDRDAYRAAYDARECGTTTPEQDALLERIEGGG